MCPQGHLPTATTALRLLWLATHCNTCLTIPVTSRSSSLFFVDVSTEAPANGHMHLGRYSRHAATTRVASLSAVDVSTEAPANGRAELPKNFETATAEPRIYKWWV